MLTTLIQQLSDSGLEIHITRFLVAEHPLEFKASIGSQVCEFHRITLPDGGKYFLEVFCTGYGVAYIRDKHGNHFSWSLTTHAATAILRAIRQRYSTDYAGTICTVSNGTLFQH
jgi:hypothetical protein